MNQAAKASMQDLRRTVSACFSRFGRRIATVAAVLIAVSLGYHAIFGANGLSAYQQKLSQHESLQKQIEQLEQENARLQQHVDQLKSDPDAIEHEARVILRYTKPGEVIYALNDKPESKSDAKPAAK